MIVLPVGSLRLNHMRGAFPLQTQPEVALPTQLVSLSAANTVELSGARADGIAGGMHHARFFAPHNQRIGAAYIYQVPILSPTLIDNDQYFLPGLPEVSWDIRTSYGVNLQCYPYRPTNYQRIEAKWDGDSTVIGPASCQLYAEASFRCQWFVLQLTRTIFGGIAADQVGSYDLRFTAGFRRWSVYIDNGTFAQVRVSDAGLDVYGYFDEANANWQIIQAHLKLGVGASKAQGDILPGPGEGALDFEATWFGNALCVTVGAQTDPLRLPVVPGAPPTAPTLATAGGGSLPANSYSFGYTWVDANGVESLLSPTAAIAVDGSQSVRVTIPSAPAAVVTINVYEFSQHNTGNTVATGGYVLVGSYSNPTGYGSTLTEIIDDIPSPSGPAAPTFTPPVITGVQVVAIAFSHLSIGVHPGKFLPNPQIISSPLDVGFPPDSSTPPYYTIHGVNTAVQRASGQAWSAASPASQPLVFPPGGSMTVTQVGDPTDELQQWRLGMSTPVTGNYAGYDYADWSCFATIVTIRVNGLQSTAVTPSQAVIPKAITERYTFDPFKLSMRHTISVTLDNWRGQWSGQSGNVAVKLWLDYLQPEAFGIDSRRDETGLFPRILGYLQDYEFPRENNFAHIVMSGEDQMGQIERRTLPLPPLMDGWNHYYAAYYLAQYAGITASQMAFASLIPDEPYGIASADTDPFFLPIGDGFHPWTPRTRTDSCMGFLDTIRKPSGFLLYVDNTGLLQYHQWVPFSPATAVRVFTEGPTGGSGSTQGENLSEFWNFRFKTSTRNVYNRVHLVGVNPWDVGLSLNIENRVDQDSIDAPPGMEPGNFVGFPTDYVWMDSRFSNPAYAATSADNLLTILRLPAVDGGADCWLQPDLFPMDVIFLQESRSGCANIPLYLLSVANTWQYAGGGQMQAFTSMDGKYLV